MSLVSDMSRESHRGSAQYDYPATSDGNRHFHSNEMLTFFPDVSDIHERKSSPIYPRGGESFPESYDPYSIPRPVSDSHRADVQPNHRRNDDMRDYPYIQRQYIKHESFGRDLHGSPAHPYPAGSIMDNQRSEVPSVARTTPPVHPPRSPWNDGYPSHEWNNLKESTPHGPGYDSDYRHPRPHHSPMDVYRGEYPAQDYDYPHYADPNCRMDGKEVYRYPPHRDYHHGTPLPPVKYHPGHHEAPHTKYHDSYYPDTHGPHPHAPAYRAPHPSPYTRRQVSHPLTPYSRGMYPPENNPYYSHIYPPPLHRDVNLHNTIPRHYDHVDPRLSNAPYPHTLSKYGVANSAGTSVAQVDIAPSMLPNVEVRRVFLESQWALLRSLLLARFSLATGRPEVAVLNVPNLKSAIVYFGLPLPFLSSTIVSKVQSYVTQSPSSSGKRRNDPAQDARTDGVVDVEPLPEVDLMYIPNVPHSTVPHPLAPKNSGSYDPEALLTIPTSMISNADFLKWSGNNLTRETLGWWITNDTKEMSSPSEDISSDASTFDCLESEFEDDILMPNKRHTDWAKDPEQALIASTVGIFSAQIISLRRWKSKLCLAWMRSNGKCPRDKDCDFAHGTEEIRSPGGVPKGDKYKRRLCRVWLDTCGAFCMHGDHCCFAHGVHELRILDPDTRSGSLATHSTDSISHMASYDSPLEGGRSLYQDYERNLINGMETLGLGPSLGLSNLRSVSIISTGSASNHSPSVGTPTSTKYKPALCRAWLEGIAKAAAVAAMQSLKIDPDLTLSLVNDVTDSASNSCTHGKYCTYAHGSAELRLPTHAEQVQVLTALLSEPYNEAITQDDVDAAACTSRELLLLLIASGLLVGGLSPSHQNMIATAVHGTPTLFATEGDTVDLDEDDALGLVNRAPPTNDGPGLGLRHISPVFHGLPHAIAMALTAAMRSPTLLLLVPSLLNPPSPSMKSAKSSATISIGTPSPMNSVHNASTISTNSNLQTNSWSSDNNISEQLQVQRHALSRAIATIGFDATDICIAFAAIAIGFVKVPVPGRARKLARKIIHTAIPIGTTTGKDSDTDANANEDTISPFTPGTTGRYAVFIKRARAAFADESV